MDTLDRLNALIAARMIDADAGIGDQTFYVVAAAVSVAALRTEGEAT
jgi:hypothetical protein